MRASGVTIASFMTRDIICIDTQGSLTEVARILASGMVSCVVVVDEDEPVGIVTERDLALVVAGIVDQQILEGTPVSEVMGTPIMTVKDSETLLDALGLIDRVQIRHLPVVDEMGKLVGVVTQSDLLGACRELLS